MFNKLLKTAMSQNGSNRRSNIRRNILHDLAKMGGSIFGPVAKGTRREFFCLDEHTWVWHEEWKDAQGVFHVRTTRYDIRPHGVFKAQDGQPYHPLSPEEAKRFAVAIVEYQRRMHDKFDPLLAAAGV